MLTELAQVSGIPLGPIRLIGAEIVFGSDIAGNSRGRVWLPLQASNHLIYGKNGVGKSTVVELLRCALTGEEPLDDARVDLFIELDESLPFPIRREESIEAVIPLDFDGGDSSQSQLLIDPDDEEPVDETDSDESQEDSEHDLKPEHTLQYPCTALARRKNKIPIHHRLLGLHY